MLSIAIAIAGWLLSLLGAIFTHRGATAIRTDTDGVFYLHKAEDVKLMWIGVTTTSFGATVGLVGTLLGATQ